LPKLDNYSIVVVGKILNPADVNRGGAIDIPDISIVAVAFGSKLGDEKWNVVADIAEPHGEISTVMLQP
jgi:hypothetical protein